MTAYCPETYERLMASDRVRNVSVIAHVDHGKTTLTDSLLARAGLLKAGQAGDRRGTDTRKDEQERGITIKSTAVSLVYDVRRGEAGTPEPETPDQLLVNLIDSPGHVDFSSEVTAALRVSDGALVVVDAVSGVCVQTETVLRQALAERVQPVLLINKLDRCILEKQTNPEELYQGLVRIIADVNNIIATFSESDGPLKDMKMDPVSGNVAFCAGLQGWGFTLPQMAEVYSQKLSANSEKLTRRLWSDNFYDGERRKWVKAPGANASRGFCQFVLEPIYKMLEDCHSPDRQSQAVSRAAQLGVTVPAAELSPASPRDLVRSTLGRWLPAADAMLRLMERHLPSPRAAQTYRTELLYEGPEDDQVAIAMKQCDPTGPLMMYITKMFPSTEKGRFLAFGRVFSGTLSAGQKVTILGPNYSPSEPKSDRFSATVPRLLTMVAGTTKSVAMVPCGNVCSVAGIDKFLVKTGTLTTCSTAHNLKVLKFSVSPVVQVAVEAQKAADLPKLIEGLRRLAKSDPMVQVTHEAEQSQQIVSGAGELHLEICLKDLEEVHAGVPIRRSRPIVTYKETVTAASSQVCLAKSTNKHNRIYMTATPLPAELVSDIEKGVVSPAQDAKERARYLADTYGWDVTEARKIWCFGPNGTGPNLLVDCTKGVQNLSDARDTITAGFQWAVKEGVLCEESMRGVRYNITDVRIHNDPACRKGGQMIPAARRAVLAASLTAAPTLMEPVFRVQIQVPETMLGGVYGVLNKRRGVIVDKSQPSNTPLLDIKAHLPVAESFGFSEELRAATSGQAFPTCVFDHWQLLPGGDPLVLETKAAATVTDIRRRKGLALETPKLDNFLDKL